MIGFYHAEDYTFGTNYSWIAWKSIGVCFSSDNGATMVPLGQIITGPETKPSTPTFGGVGDFCVMRNNTSPYWTCIFAGTLFADQPDKKEFSLSCAISDDADGRPGTWRNYYQGSFSEPSLGGKYSYLPGFDEFPAGAQSPTIHYNTYLRKYVMVFQTNTVKPGGTEVLDNSLYMSTSDNLVKWTKPELMLGAQPGERFWYATVFSRTSDVEAGQNANLVYSYQYPWWSDRNQKVFYYRDIQFW
jgi:hypothetical protein